MIRPVQIIRLFQINIILMRHAFTPTVLGSQSPFLRFMSYLNPFNFFRRKKSRGESIRTALEELGPIFVKFGQLLSTRRDLLPDDIADELAKLQDRVPPFPGIQARQIVEKSFNKNIFEIFSRFDENPLASASIAQVHVATLLDGTDIVVKIRRPNIEKIIRHDIAILYFVAELTERFWKQGRRLHPIGLVTEFEQTILDELDLMREAANATQLRRNFLDSEMMYVPKIYWSYTRHNVMVMERIYGIPIADVASLINNNTNMKKLAEYGVEIFFTQVFRDSFFHADMHPGNLFVDCTNPDNPKYIGVDFGIMGTLSPADQRYLAENLLAFFNRDYRRVAILHVQSGWVPPQTRIDQFESAIRTVCEPIFERPIRDISFGQLLLRLFQTAERFQMEVQPQLMLLQKTLLAIEGLGRQLYPDLNLWETAKPFMTRWMRKQRGVVSISKISIQDWPETILKISKTPQLFYDVLQEFNQQQRIEKYQNRVDQYEKKPVSNSRRHGFIFGAGLSLALIWIFNSLFKQVFFTPTDLLSWLLPVVGITLLVVGWLFRV